MASGFILALAKRGKPAPGRSSSEDAGDSPDDLAEEEDDDYSDVVMSALDDLADILGVKEKDRDRVDSALEDLCTAYSKRTMDEE